MMSAETTVATSDPASPPGRSRVKLVPLVPLVVLLAVGLSLRLSFPTGVVHTDDLTYARTAYMLSQGEIAHEHGFGVAVTRVGIYAPLALSYRLFGVSDATTLAWPLLCSLATILLVYLVTKELCGEPAALVAAFLWTLLPLDIALATSLLPDGPLATFSTAAVYAMLRANRALKWRAIAWYGASVASVTAAILMKQTGLITAGFLVLSGLARWRDRKPIRWGLAATMLVAVALFAYYYRFSQAWASTSGGATWITVQAFANTATDWFFDVQRSAEFYFLAPLIVVSIAIALTRRQRGTMFAFVWLAATFLYIELGTRTPFEYVPWNPDNQLRHWLFVVVPCAVLVGSYVADGLRPSQAAISVVPPALIVAVVGFLGSRGAPRVAEWAVTVDHWTRPFAALSSIAAIGTVFGGIASPLFIGGPPARWKGFARAALLTTVAFASLHPTFEAAVKFRLPVVDEAREAVAFLRRQTDRPWVTQNDSLAARFDYESRFTRGYDYDRPTMGRGLRLAPDEITEIGNAYVVVDEAANSRPKGPFGRGPDYLVSPPGNWLPIATFGHLIGHRLRLYRVLPPAGASR